MSVIDVFSFENYRLVRAGSMCLFCDPIFRDVCDRRLRSIPGAELPLLPVLSLGIGRCHCGTERYLRSTYTGFHRTADFPTVAAVAASSAECRRPFPELTASCIRDNLIGICPTKLQICDTNICLYRFEPRKT